MNRSPWAVGLWIAGLAVCVFVIARTEFSSDMSAFLPRSPSPAQQILVDQLRQGVVSRLLLVSIEGAPPEALAELSKNVAGRLRQDPAFALVQNGEDTTFEADRGFLWRNRYLLSPAVAPERFTIAGLHQSLDNDLRLLSSGIEPLVKADLANDPTSELLTVIKQFTGNARPTVKNGVWFAKDGSRAVLVAQTAALGFDLDAQEQALTKISNAFVGAKQAVKDADKADYKVIGPGVFAVHSRATMKSEISRLSLLASVLVAAVLLAAYRSPRLLVLALLPVASGALAGIAAVSLGFGFVHGITLGFGVTLIGEAVDYAIYVFSQTAPASGPGRTLRRIWPTLRLGVLTSICGFSAMLFSNFTGFAQLGLFTIAGLIVAVSVTRWVLPALMPANFAAIRPTRFASWLFAAARWTSRLRIPLLAIIAAAAFSIVFHHGGFWNDELASLSPMSGADKSLDEQLRRDIGAPDVRYLLVAAAPDAEQALQASERMGAKLDALVKQGVLAGFDSPSRYLPSRAAQSARQAALPAADTLQANLDQALSGLPFRENVFAPFLSDIAAAKTQPLLDRTSLQDTSLALKLDSLLLERKGSWLAMMPLRGVTDPAAIAGKVAEWHDGVFLDLKGESDRLLQSYRRSAVILALSGGLAIAGLLWIGLRSPRRAASVLAPLAAAVIVTMAILIAGDHRLTIFNLFGLLLVVAVGSNYALFFERLGLGNEHFERTVTSLVLANLCTVIGFGVLSLSQIPALHGIGTTVALGTFLSLLFSSNFAAPAGSVRVRPRPRRGQPTSHPADAHPGIEAIYNLSPNASDDRILLVLLPGVKSRAVEFAANGFIQMVEDKDWAIDTVATEPALDLYLDGAIADRLHSDIVAPALARGYSRIWLAGISLGALGTLSYVYKHPGIVEGVILLAPFLGTEGAVAEVARSGGFLSWNPGEVSADDNERRLLAWLKTYRRDAKDWPILYLGYGHGDRFEKGQAMLAKLLPGERVFTVKGAHNWETWTALWRRILDAAPFANRPPIRGREPADYELK